MENEWDYSPHVLLGSDNLRSVFLYYLNKIYCVKTLFIERMPEIVHHSDFIDLQQAVEEMMDDAGRQILRLEEIYVLLDAVYSFEDCANMISIIEDAFTSIYNHSSDPIIRDMSILFYLQNLESIKIASFQVLRMMAVKLEDKQIIKLLKENFDEAKDSRVLLLLITAKYLSN